MSDVTVLETALNPTEAAELTVLEGIIERGMKTFIEVGNALMEIREGRLYREGYATFEEYCQERWGMNRAHAYRQINAAEVATNLSPIGDIPATESQARPLTKLEPEEQRQAWQTVVDTAPNGKVTAAHVQSVVDDMVRPVETLKPADQPANVHDSELSEPDSVVADGMAVHYSSKSAEHYTPDEIVGAAVLTLGYIDLDPCSNDKESPNIPAQTHYTVDDDGLTQYWEGNVYMNPPYGHGITDWVNKLCEAHEAGDVPAAIALVPARTDTAWMRRFKDYPICFISGRLTFKGNQAGAPFPSAVVYLGPDIDRFSEHFGPFGGIWKRIN